MQFAYPPRKSSNPPPFRSRTSKIPLTRRYRLKTLVLILLAIISLVYLLSGFNGGKSKSKPREPSGNPPVVIVTVLDWTLGQSHVQSIQDNRIKYAKRHGYETFFTKHSDYDLHGSPFSWAKVIAIRHALSKYPDCRYIWYLDQDALIMNPKLTVEGNIMDPRRLESLMIKDFPVVPPDSIIKTFSHVKGGEVDFVLSQDNEGLSPASFILRNGDWATFFLDIWYDPLYRSYNFQKADTHALEHIVQWHPTILSKLALIPQRTLNSHSEGEETRKYHDGDMVVRFPGCTKSGDKSCDKLMKPFVDKWQAAFNA